MRGRKLDGSMLLLSKDRLVRWVAITGTILAVLVLPLAATTRMYTVAASSMMPAVVKGDKVVVNLISYDLKIPFTTRRILRWSAPQVGDIVLFSVPNGGEGVYRFQKSNGRTRRHRRDARDNRLSINGQAATYESLDASAFQQLPADDLPGRHFERETIQNQSRPIVLNASSPEPRSFGPITVPPNNCFVLGDYRDNSTIRGYSD